jgi:ADP-ribose pyrophosphatase YjhB (NUDIX family)
MHKYSKQTKMLVSTDSIIFGYDGEELKILLIKRGFEPEKGKWSLMGGFIKKGESIDAAANRVLLQLTGLSDVYLEQLYCFGEPGRDPTERTISVAYFALLDRTRYKPQIHKEYHAGWFPLNKMPRLIFDHRQMVDTARAWLQYKASLHPILFELLPKQFTIPRLQGLFEQVYETRFDKRNFSRKIMASGLLVKLAEKEKTGSKKGAFLYRLNRKNYKANVHRILQVVPVREIKQ